MGIKITIPNTSSDTLTFGSANTTTAAQIAGIDSGSTNGQLAIYTTASGTSTERVRVDSSGNVGIGVTPSAWSGIFRTVQIGSDGAWVGGRTDSQNQAWLGTNAYYNGTNWIYKASTTAGQLAILGNTFNFYQAATGTAGNTATFTQAMTLDSNGNLAVGTTSTPSADYRAYFLKDVATNTVSIAVRNTNSTGASRLILGNDAGVARFTIGYTGSASSGYVGGASAAWLGPEAAEPLAFQTSGTERMRIDSSGNLLVGATSVVGNERLNVTKDAANQEVARIYNSNNSTPWGILVSYSAAAPNGTSNSFIGCYDNVGTRATIRSNGGIANYSGNNVNLSDRREKTNFAPAKPYLDVICAIPVQTFNYIDQNREEDDGLTLGVVAQDVQAVAPELVSESNWGTEENPKMRLSIYQTDLQYALMKCIQEQQALIQTLTDRITALENK